MSDKIICPACKNGHDPGDYPDHWQSGNSAFKFECAECETEFWVGVYFDPVFFAGEIITRGEKKK